jgi:hypothetical protein
MRYRINFHRNRMTRALPLLGHLCWKPVSAVKFYLWLRESRKNYKSNKKTFYDSCVRNTEQYLCYESNIKGLKFLKPKGDNFYK